MSIINKYHVKNPEFFGIENILKKHVLDYNKKFHFYFIICEWKIDFDGVVISVRSKRLFNIQSPWGLRTYLVAKTEYSESKG